MDATNGWTEARSESFQRAAELAEKARALDDSDPDVHALLGSLFLSRRQHEQAIAAGEKAVALGPNHADSHALLAMTKFYAGRPEEAVELVQRLDQVSTSLLQRRLRVGYPRAARIMDALHQMGVVGPEQPGGRTRQVLVSDDDDPLGDFVESASGG